MHLATPTTLPIPSIVHRLQPLVIAALRAGVPMGPNILMVVRGRRSGLPRTVPVALLRADGHDVVFSPFGEVAWVHNLRAAGRAELRRGRRRREVTAVPIPPEEAARYLEIGLGEFLGVPVIGPMVAGWYGITRASTSEDYAAAARSHPAFALADVLPDADERGG